MEIKTPEGFSRSRATARSMLPRRWFLEAYRKLTSIWISTAYVWSLLLPHLRASATSLTSRPRTNRGDGIYPYGWYIWRRTRKIVGVSACRQVIARNFQFSRMEGSGQIGVLRRKSSKDINWWLATGSRRIKMKSISFYRDRGPENYMIFSETPILWFAWLFPMVFCIISPASSVLYVFACWTNFYRICQINPW